MFSLDNVDSRLVIPDFVSGSGKSSIWPFLNKFLGTEASQAVVLLMFRTLDVIQFVTDNDKGVLETCWICLKLEMKMSLN